MHGQVCEVGLRRKTYNVLCGSVLSVWGTVEQVLTHDGNKKGTNSKMQVSHDAKSAKISKPSLLTECLTL